MGGKSNLQATALILPTIINPQVFLLNFLIANQWQTCGAQQNLVPNRKFYLTMNPIKSLLLVLLGTCYLVLSTCNLVSNSPNKLMCRFYSVETIQMIHRGARQLALN